VPRILLVRKASLLIFHRSSEDQNLISINRLNSDDTATRGSLVFVPTLSVDDGERDVDFGIMLNEN
jgi:hypothetical protein